MRNASITNARNRKANIRAVISPSKAFAISAALFFRASFLELVFCPLLEYINTVPFTKRALYSSFRKGLSKTLIYYWPLQEVLFGAHIANNLEVSQANTKQ